MLKIFSTQMNGIFKKITDEEEFSLEDAGRLLAQAGIGEGKIYIYGLKEMKGILHEALEGKEPFPYAEEFAETALEMGKENRFLIFSRHSDDVAAVKLAGQLREADLPFVAVSSVKKEKDSVEDLVSLADVHIDLKIQRGLIPDESGERFGYPYLMAALYAYHGIKFTLEEILKEYEE
ncbi:DUF2529 domain-containing protein [Bacillus massiliglaciei]|uniref:DUF2529 domain-containing protein n=1 Tax=Bacillus massiliglaciei TaxID=1816693 RepID=UPI000DA60C05|nr:DUF2529 domain-containing protein [Bacillus massiliglaciei]